MTTHKKAVAPKAHAKKHKAPAKVVLAEPEALPEVVEIPEPEPIEAQAPVVPYLPDVWMSPQDRLRRSSKTT